MIGPHNRYEENMAAPYSLDLRLRAVKAYESGDGSQREVARIFKLGIRTLARYWEQYQETGDIKPAEYKRGRKPAVDEKQMLRIKELVLQYPDASLNELCRHYNKARNKKIGISIMFRVIYKLGFRRKKKSLYAEQQDMPEVKKTEKNLSKKLVN
jgi:transposase